jgi:hypothetical protein
MKTFANQLVEFEIGDKLYTVPNLSLIDEFEIDEYIHDFLKNEGKENETEFEYLKRVLGRDRMVDFIGLGKRLIPEFEEDSMMSIALIFFKICMMFIGKKVDLKKK